MDLSLKDKTILVTAASRGLGLSVAKSLVAEDANVVICSRDEPSLKHAIDILGKRARYIVADVSKKEDVKMLLDDIKSTSGTLDGLFVNAGGPPPGRFADLTDEEWLKGFNLTLMSAIWLTREALPLLKLSGSPSVLYSTSISVKQPIGNLLLSNALRPAVIGMMRTLADEVEFEGIRVNAVCPGYISTERVKELFEASGDARAAEDYITNNIPLKRLGNPDEFGSVCAFILSPVASYVHGALLLVDGGMYRGMM